MWNKMGWTIPRLERIGGYIYGGTLGGGGDGDGLLLFYRKKRSRLELEFEVKMVTSQS
jgi:hypothetical protein